MNTIVDKFNNTDTIMNYEKTYIESFEDNLKFYKNNTALVFKKKSLSYKELNDVGNKIAHILNKLGNKTNDRIGIYIDESIEMITSIIGVLKSSSSFIPMPDIFPINRVHDIIENANIKMLITKRELIKNEIISAKTLFIDEIDFTNENYENYENLKIESRAEDCIYSIYTSGSTGKPKGVSINNKNIINFSNYIKNRCDISKKDNFSKFAGFGFDASIIEIMPCLLNGCALHILEKELKSNINKLNEYFEDNKITISFLPTQFAELFMFETNNNSLRCLLTGGEKLKKVKLGNYRLLNFYGPTETTIAATCYEVLDEDIENIPIGKPLDNYKVYIVDPSMNLCPVGVEGELCAAGDGLGLGYIDLPEITAEKFVDNPFVSKEIITYKKYNKMYKTGDSAKWLPDGNIEYIGRMDFQVKIRGYRIELGEIEQKLIHYKDIKECTVIALKDNLDQDYICAYYVSKNKIDKNILKDFLSHSLPEYMIPSTFYWLEQFPINANGKIDRKNLPVPKLVKEEEYEEAINEKERLICKHLIEIFNLKKVSIMSNFFNLGGNSLKAMQLVSKIKNDYEISVSDILKAKTIRDISTKLSNKKESIRISKSTATQFPATKSQEGIYFASSIHPESIIYNTPTAISIEGMLNKNKLEESINLVLKNNRILRSYFTIENNEVIQNISECKPISLNYLKVNKEEVSSHFLNFVKPFILQEPLLLKFRLLEIEKNHHILFIDIHHLINDGYSQNLLVKEIFDLYNNFNVDNQKIDYLDYSLIEKEINKEKALKYWKDNLNQFEKTQIPFDFPETDFNNDGHQVILNIPEVLYNKLNSISKNLNITNYTVFLTAFAILEYKFSRKNTVTIGGFFSGRDNLETQNMLGMFVSTLPITLEINPSSSIKQLLIQVQEKVTEILENQDVSLSELVELSQLKIENGRNPFFTNSFNFVELFNYSSENINFKNINIHGLNKAHYDLSLNLFKIENKIEIVFEFSNTSYKRESIETVKDSYLEILNELTCSENSINKISFISPNNYDIILNKFNHTDFDFDNNLTFIELFEKTVEKHPNRIAISFNNHTLSYLELNTVGNQIARYLKDNSVKYNDIIAIYLDESLEMITGIIGILKTSASYIPIPDSFPIDRVNEILRDSYANILITNSKLTEKVLAIDSSIKIVYLDKHPFSKYEKSNLYIETKLNDCLYNIYTSGSTGKPKGVSINNRSTINFVNNIIQKYDITEKDQFSKFAGYGFDASIVEIMPSLISGSCLHIIDKSIKLDLQKLNQYFEKNKITVTFLPTQFAELFMQQVENKSLRYLITGGDRLKKVKLGNYKILNIYGPTETTVACTIYEVTNAHEKNIPIGSPLLNYKIYITDADMNLCPIGVEGELCIAGEGLAIEYINLPELTSQKFIQNPFINPNEKNYDKYSKMYRSADLAKWLPDGNVEFIGRIDFQVKIRGFRIELGEIEQSILNMEGITECLVLSLKDNSQEDYLCAYYVSENPINENVFHEFLSINLPEYMIPASFYWLKQFPINQNGKIDRKKLPIPEVKVEKNIILPENKNEEIVFNHVNDILKITHLSMESNFFQLGGNSLKAVELVSKLQNKFNISIGDIFKYKTIKNIASSLKEKTNFNHIKKCTLEKYPISSSQKGIYFASIIDETSTIYNIPLAIEINGNLNKDKLGLSLDKLIKNNRIFCTKFILENNSVFQYIDKNTEIKKDFQKSRIEEIPALFNEFIKPFNLAEPPLIRIKLIQIENKKHILFLDTHHIINDGFSHNILIQELFNLYFENPSIINELDYLDFAIFENKNLEMRENSTKYWKTKANQIEKTYIPFDFPEFQFSDSGEIITLNLPKEFSEKILEFSSKNNLTLYNILLSTFFILIYKISRKQNVTIGGFFSGRYLADMQNMLGMFVSTLPITYKVNSEETIESFLHSIQMQISEVLEYQNFSIAELSELSESQSENGRNKFFNNAFNFIETTDLNYKNLSLNLLDLKAKTKAHFDLTLNCYKMNDEIKIDFEYSTKSYKAESIRTYIDSYYKILTEITEKNNTIKNIEFIPNNNKEIILSKFNKTEVINNYSKSFIDIFQDFAKNNPYNEALVFKDQRYNYLELNTISNQLAKHLINLGVKSNDKIGIYIDESLEMITSIFAILKTTASFIPMPNTFPINRVKDILSDSESKILFTKKSFVNKDEIDIPNLKIIYFEDLNIKDFSKDDLNLPQNIENCIYSIYTSGSTGKPKGVSISHKNLINLSNFYIKKLNLSPSDNISKYAGFGFDASILEIMPTYLSGGTLHILDKSLKLDATKLNQYFEKNNITSCFLPTQFAELFIHNINNNSLKSMMLGGEKLKKVVLKNYKIFNIYGPSETTIAATNFEVDREDYLNIPIGKPLDNYKIYIVDQDLNLCPIGVAGELCISGHGVGMGYINLPNMNKEKFIENPFHLSTDHSLLYKSGDLAKWLPDGNIEFIGRIDFQVKIRGFRIELGEIEANISLIPEVNECIVLAQKDHLKQDYLCAYYVSEREISPDIFTEFLAKNLPEYMIPPVFYWMNHFPINDNGKVDRKKLPIPEIKKSEHINPRNEKEKVVAQYFEDTLEIKNLSVLSNFFEIGGNSLKAVQLVSKIQKQYDIKVSEIFKYKTIENIAKNLKEYAQGFNIEHRFNLIKQKIIETSIVENKYDELQDKIYSDKMEHYQTFVPAYNNNLNILVTGATGYLGSHVILELLFQTKFNISVIIRNSSEDTKTKLVKILDHYNGEKISESFLERIRIYGGDISDPNFKLNKSDYTYLNNNINCVINCAANVKHYGEYNEFYQDNVNTVKNLIEFCSSGEKKKLHHVSTYSVSMIEKPSVNSNKAELFTEFDFRDPSLIENYYIRTKAEAETLINESCKNNIIDANIYRVGNLVFNTKTNLHQINIENNAFYQKIKCLLNIDSLCTHDSIDLSELSPINKTAQAIVLLLQQKNLKNDVFHVYNEKSYKLSDIFKLNHEIKLNIEDIDTFIDKLSRFYKFNYTNKMLNNFMLHMGWLNFLNSTPDITIKNDKTSLILNKLAFSWGEINDSNFTDMINHAYENRIDSLAHYDSMAILDIKNIKDINSYGKLKILEENEIILSPDLNEGSIYIIINGFAQISIKSNLGGWISSIGILSEGDLIGIENLTHFQNKNIIIDSILGEIVLLEIDPNSLSELKIKHKTFYYMVFTYAIKSLHNNNLLISNFV